MENEQEKPGGITDQVIEQKVIEAVAKALDLEPGEVTLSSSLENDLGAESLDYLDIAFMLEREFKVEFPREDLLQRASDHFGEDALFTKEGVVTDLGLRLLRKEMPEIDAELIKPGLSAVELRPLFKVQTLARVVKRLLKAKEEFPRDCPDCGEEIVESENLPQFECPKCTKIIPFPTGDEVIFQGMIEASKDEE